jgi:ferrous iron transport protein B
MRLGLIGNPNTGKSSIFNLLTGLRQHVGNFPGVTVDKKYGRFAHGDKEYELIDFPGTYSIYPRSADEKVVYDSLINAESDTKPQALLVVVDASNLERNLLLFSQVYDLELPTVMILNMVDIADRKNLKIDIDGLKSRFPDVEIVTTNARIKIGKSRILDAVEALKLRSGNRFSNSDIAGADDVHAQEEETLERQGLIRAFIANVVKEEKQQETFSSKLDKVLVHPVLGYMIFGLVLITIFQFIFTFASLPMDLIDGAFADLSDYANSLMPQGIFTDLLTQGIIPGIGGVVIFIPQIALLFFFIGILEESGYLARVVFIMDRLMRPFGLNGRSIVPLMSSVACAIPGVMAARTIPNRKERLITVLVAPLMSCSARIPVYTLLIALVIPEQKVFGFMNMQGLVLFGLYMLGIIMALLVAMLLNAFLLKKEKGSLILEMPSYKLPRLSNLGLIVWEKVRVFVWDAGKIILAISIVLWALATYGPSDRMEKAGIEATQTAQQMDLSAEETAQFVSSKKLENSYIGIIGKTIEPAITPIGYDWKIGIALVTSFAAREVFVGSMATIYAVQDDGENTAPLLDKMGREKRDDGTAVYSLATGVSLMVFYVFAMMCMATLAVVKRETKSWKWPIIQVVYMGGLAYLGSYIAFITLS